MFMSNTLSVVRFVAALPLTIVVAGILVAVVVGDDTSKQASPPQLPSGAACIAGAKQARCVGGANANPFCRVYACYTCGIDGNWGFSSASSAPCSAKVIGPISAGQTAAERLLPPISHAPEEDCEP